MDSILAHLKECPGELLLAFTAVFLTIYLIYRRYVNDAGRKLPPALPSLPIIGSIPFLPTKNEDLNDFFFRKKTRHGQIFSFRIGPK